jgi:NAD(P)-dependent dehydrogenase (short-subunit alcohol dehydrogenase family)
LRAHPHGITVNAVAPGAFTRMQDDVVTDEAFRELAKQTMKAELVVPAVILLAHDSASVTGQTFEAFSGRVGRYVSGAVPGFHDPELTVESSRPRRPGAVPPHTPRRR